MHIKPDLEQQPVFPVAIVVSQFNREITQKLQDGAVSRLQEYGWREQDMLVVEVPGAVEIPLIVKQLAKTNKYAVIIALGAVIRGETSHYDYVCNQVSEGCQQVALSFDIPVIFGLLTTENEEQARDRVGGRHGHKGIEAVDCALAMNSLLTKLPSM